MRRKSKPKHVRTKSNFSGPKSFKSRQLSTGITKKNVDLSNFLFKRRSGYKKGYSGKNSSRNGRAMNNSMKFKPNQKKLRTIFSKFSSNINKRKFGYKPDIRTSMSADRIYGEIKKFNQQSSKHLKEFKLNQDKYFA